MTMPYITESDLIHLAFHETFDGVYHWQIPAMAMASLACVNRYRVHG